MLERSLGEKFGRRKSERRRFASDHQKSQSAILFGRQRKGWWSWVEVICASKQFSSFPYIFLFCVQFHYCLCCITLSISIFLISAFRFNPSPTAFPPMQSGVSASHCPGFDPTGPGDSVWNDLKMDGELESKEAPLIKTSRSSKHF